MKTKLSSLTGAALALAAAAAPAPAQDFDLLHLDGYEACALAYPDGDTDGFGAATNVAHRCDPLAPGFARAGGDCDDGDPLRHPGIVEAAPDDAYADENCDGVDGDVDLAIFVSPNGSALAGCGSRANPCTFGRARAEAAATGRSQLYLEVGVHAGPENFFASGDPVRGIYGGYAPGFGTRAASASPRTTTIVGAATAFGSFALDFVGAGVYQVSDVAIEAPSIALQRVTGMGLSSYGVRVYGGAMLVLRHADVRAGDGADGREGDDGLSANPLARVAAMNGVQGQPGLEVQSCNATTRGGGGAGGTNTCSGSPSTRAMNGGAGGFGGLADTNCSNVPFNDGTATAGTFGGDAAFANGSAGEGGSPGSGGNSCGSSGSGALGLSLDGAPGSAAANEFRIVMNRVETNSGLGGATGENGSGGGGGGGAGGCDEGIDSYGAGGGGGGAGGCAARVGGGGGAGGGSSIGVLVVDSTFDAEDVLITTGSGGNGGTGGDGGTGQEGGLGQLGGPGDGAASGGRGGNGARGGHSGAGAGGNGGHSFGILASNATLDGPFTTTVGSAGGGGAPGTPAPGTGPAQPGHPGTTAAIRICATPGGC